MDLGVESQELWLARVKPHKTPEPGLEPQSRGSKNNHDDSIQREVKSNGQKQVDTQAFLKREVWAMAMTMCD